MCAQSTKDKGNIMAGKQSGFIWYELMTTDVAGAKAFYQHVVDWNFQEMPMPDMTYTVLKAGDSMVGGIMPLPQHLVDAQVNPHWVGYLRAADVDAMTTQIKQLGGALHVPPAEIPGVGRFAVVADPQGSIFHLLQPNQPGEPNNAVTPGHIGWRELHTTDWPKAFEFYSTLFGWERGSAIDMGPMGTYQLFTVDGVDYGGMMNSPEAAKHCFWLYYFSVDDIDAAARRVTEAGGKLMHEPRPVPGGSFIVQATDPQGAGFALVGARKN